MSSQPEPVREHDLYQVLKYLRDMRVWCIQNKVDPWATRQALITALAMDTQGWITGGKAPADIVNFDMLAKEKAKDFIEEIEQEVKVKLPDRCRSCGAVGCVETAVRPVAADVISVGWRCRICGYSWGFL